MADSDSEREANRAAVEAACVLLNEAARNLAPDMEPAAIYSLAPHALAEHISGEDEQ